MIHNEFLDSDSAKYSVVLGLASYTRVNVELYIKSEPLVGLLQRSMPMITSPGGEFLDLDSDSDCGCDVWISNSQCTADNFLGTILDCRGISEVSKPRATRAADRNTRHLDRYRTWRGSKFVKGDNCFRQPCWKRGSGKCI